MTRPIIDVLVPPPARWRPFQALSQADYNALVTSGDFDPDTLYAIAPQRVMFGAREVWPGPWPGGIASVTNGISTTTNPTQVIPRSQQGNLLVAFIQRAHLDAPSGITDSAGQTWKFAANAEAAARYTGCWYAENSAAVNEVHFAMNDRASAWRIFEIADMATTDVLDATAAVPQIVGSTPKTMSLTVERRSVAFALMTSAIATPPTSEPGAPWTNFEFLTVAINVTANAAMTVLGGGQSATATWLQTGNATLLGVAFRTAGDQSFTAPQW